MELKGIDISQHNGNLDFNALKQGGVTYVIPRVGYGCQDDAYFKTYVNGAKQTGIKIPAIYLFDYALNDQQAIEEAEYAVAKCKEAGLPPETVIFFDCEYDSVEWAKKNGADKSPATVQRHTRLFADKVKAAGYQAGYYANLDWMDNYYGYGVNFKDLYFWYARYNSDPEYDSDIWQYSSTGKIGNLPNNFDVNISYGRFSDLVSGGEAEKEEVKTEMEIVYPAGKSPHDFYMQYNGQALDIDGYYGAQCPIKGTMIMMEDGSYLPVEKLMVGDKLFGGNVVVSNEPAKSEILVVETNYGLLPVTPDHRFIMINGKAVKAKDLKPGERIGLCPFMEPLPGCEDWIANQTFPITFIDKEDALACQMIIDSLGYSSKLEANGFCDDEFTLSIGERNVLPGAEVEHVWPCKGEADIYVLNVSGDHTYYAENHHYHNCWDGAMFYSRWLGYPTFHCTTSGYAKDIWNNRNSSGILNYYEAVQRPFADGDIIVWGESTETPLSHIAIFRCDNGNGTFVALGQNQGGVNGAFNQMKFSYNGVLGGFRPKCFIKKKEVAAPAPVKPAQKTIVPKTDSDVFRLYNPNNGDHLYTMDLDEAKAAQKAGWKYEGIAWEAPKTGGSVYRLYHKDKGHIFTISEDEKGELQEAGWTYEGVAFKSGGKNPIYKMSNPYTGAFILTKSREEHNALAKIGWFCEGQDMKF